MQSRDTRIDVLKGIGILFIIMGHCGGHGRQFLNYTLFHVAIFFIASGYVFNENDSNNIINFKNKIIKLIKRLYVPWIVVGSIYSLLNNTFIKLNILTDNVALLDTEWGSYGIDSLKSFDETILYIFKTVLPFRALPKLTGASWFLATLFFVEVVYLFLDLILKRSKKHMQAMDIIVVLLYFLSTYLSTQGKIDNSGYKCLAILYSILFYHIGRRVKQWNNNIADYRLGFMIGFTVLYFAKLHGIVIRYGRQEIVDGGVLLIVSIAGYALVWGMSSYIVENYSLISKIISYIGRQSLWIMMFHQLSFKFVTYIQIKYYGLDDYLLSAYPVLYSDKMWWVAYTLTGVIIPLIFVKLGVALKSTFIKS